MVTRPPSPCSRRIPQGPLSPPGCGGHKVEGLKVPAALASHSRCPPPPPLPRGVEAPLGHILGPTIGCPDTGPPGGSTPSPGVLEKPLEKKSGRNYGPPGTKKLIYFIDDMNMPEVDKYGTVAPHTLIRQHMDHGHW